MTIFKSRTAESLNCDPEPWVDAYGRNDGKRRQECGNLVPRPEFTPTRDPEPWVSWGVRYAAQVSPSCYWSPRPEFDTPVNPILVKYRESDERTQWHMRAGSWISWPTPPYPDGAADHARRVFARLAAFTKED